MKIVPTHASYVFFNGCSNAQPYKRRREVYQHANSAIVRAMCKKLGLVRRSLNTGDHGLYTLKGVDLKEDGAHLTTFACYASPKGTDSGFSVLEVYYPPERCTQEEADRYFNARTGYKAQANREALS